MKLPPSASPGANAIAWTNPSSRPHRCLMLSASASTCAWLLTSISRMSGVGCIRRALFSVRLMARPKLVSTMSAPSRWASSAIAKAMLAGVRTPVTRIFFPSRMPGMAVRFYRSRLPAQEFLSALLELVAVDLPSGEALLKGHQGAVVADLLNDRRDNEVGHAADR